MCPSQGSPGRSGGVNIVGTASVCGDIVGGDKIIYGHTAEELVAVLEAKGFLRTADSAGLERQAIIKLAHRLKPDEVLDFDQALRELEHVVAVALDVIAPGERGKSREEFANIVLARVAEKTRAGDLDGGASTIDQELAGLDAAHRRSRVALLEEGVKVDILRRNPVAVARRIEMLVAIDHPTERPAWLPEFGKRRDQFFADGETKGINFSLTVAVELARRMLTTAHDSRERGTAAHLLGTALGALGGRGSGSARLEEAVAAYRVALAEWTRKREPLYWATAQNNLGIALAELGQRERGTARLEEAIAAYRAALEERTRERVPLDWAATQNNLGNALVKLGIREGATVRLEDAVTAYREALKEWTRERAPLDWAATHNNLGNALRNLGVRESGTARLEEAIAAYRTALEERTRERVPLDWAATQNNLGLALTRLGQLESGTERLNNAATAFRAALKERTRERVPLDWAMTKRNLGDALVFAGTQERGTAGTAWLKKAVAAYRAAAEELTRERAPVEWAMIQNNLGNAFLSLGERESGAARLKEAVAAYGTAQTVFEAAGLNEAIALCRRSRDRALRLLAERGHYMKREHLQF
jgi:tetratricopeptide (TPR) repeat protein